jgi:hypothetical protein
VLDDSEQVVGPKGDTTVWDLGKWTGLRGYASDAYIDTKSDIGTGIPTCEERRN